MIELNALMARVCFQLASIGSSFSSFPYTVIRTAHQRRTLHLPPSHVHVSPAVLDDPVTRAIPETPRHFLRKKRENGDQGISKVTFPSHHMKIKRNRKLKQQGVSSRDDVACAS